MATRRLGRPKLPQERVRRISVSFLVTPEEYRWIRKVARGVDMTISSWARERILAGYGRQGGRTARRT